MGKLNVVPCFQKSPVKEFFQILLRASYVPAKLSQDSNTQSGLQNNAILTFWMNESGFCLEVRDVTLPSIILFDPLTTLR